MKKVFIHAYDHVNFGDDLFVRTITGRYPDVQFYMQSDQKNKEIFADVKNLNILLGTEFPKKILKKIRPSLVSRYEANQLKKCDAIVYIGGSIFIEYPTWKNIVNWWKYQAENYPFYVLGANFGPYQSEAYREAMNQIFSELQDVCFRDQYSYQLFEENDHVRVAPDILFCLSDTRTAEKREEVIFSVINCKKKDEGNNKLAQYHEVYIQAMTTLAKAYLDQGKKLIYLSFCQEEGDEEAIWEIISSLGSCTEGKYEVVCYDGRNSSELLERLKYAEKIVAARFHAMILGLASGTAVLPVIYSDKTKHVLQDLDFPGDCLDIRNLEVQKLHEMRAAELSQAVIRELKKKSEAHFEKLDQVLLKN